MSSVTPRLLVFSARKRRAAIGVRLAVDERWLVARRISGDRRLELDRVRALIREQLRAERT
jgi:hypothetical protein